MEPRVGREVYGSASEMGPHRSPDACLRGQASGDRRDGGCEVQVKKQGSWLLCRPLMPHTSISLSQHCITPEPREPSGGTWLVPFPLGYRW